MRKLFLLLLLAGLQTVGHGTCALVYLYAILVVDISQHIVARVEDNQEFSSFCVAQVDRDGVELSRTGEYVI